MEYDIFYNGKNICCYGGYCCYYFVICMKGYACRANRGDGYPKGGKYLFDMSTTDLQ